MPGLISQTETLANLEHLVVKEDLIEIKGALECTGNTEEHHVGRRLIELGVGVAGGYGDVYRGTLQGLGHTPSRLVAVKELRTVGDDVTRIRVAIVSVFISLRTRLWRRTSLLNYIQRLARELRVWAKLKHPNILELVGYYLNSQMSIARLISPFMVNGNIDEYLRKTADSVSNAFRIKLVAYYHIY